MQDLKTLRVIYSAQLNYQDSSTVPRLGMKNHKIFTGRFLYEKLP